MLSEDPSVITVADPIDADALRVRHEFLTTDFCGGISTASIIGPLPHDPRW
jgi:hypothetical protein